MGASLAYFYTQRWACGSMRWADLISLTGRVADPAHSPTSSTGLFLVLLPFSLSSDIIHFNFSPQSDECYLIVFICISFIVSLCTSLYFPQSFAKCLFISFSKFFCWAFCYFLSIHRDFLHVLDFNSVSILDIENIFSQLVICELTLITTPLVIKKSLI